jgi:hypothetical protein
LEYTTEINGESSVKHYILALAAGRLLDIQDCGEFRLRVAQNYCGVGVTFCANESTYPRYINVATL